MSTATATAITSSSSSSSFLGLLSSLPTYLPGQCMLAPNQNSNSNQIKAVANSKKETWLVCSLIISYRVVEDKGKV
jgi:hypothetical protein